METNYSITDSIKLNQVSNNKLPEKNESSSNESRDSSNFSHLSENSLSRLYSSGPQELTVTTEA
ncbi:hypothetical protein YC2023_030713 [Brassica napus]